MYVFFLYLFTLVILCIYKIHNNSSVGIACSDGRRPDRVSVMPWKNGRSLVWDAACSDTFAPSHTTLAAREAGLVASQAEKAKTQKYALLGSSHYSVPVAIATSGVFGPEAISFIKELGCRIRAETGEPRSLQFLMQSIVVAVQRGSVAAVRDTSPPLDNVFIGLFTIIFSSAVFYTLPYFSTSN